MYRIALVFLVGLICCCSSLEPAETQKVDVPASTGKIKMSIVSLTKRVGPNRTGKDTVLSLEFTNPHPQKLGMTFGSCIGHPRAWENPKWQPLTYYFDKDFKHGGPADCDYASLTCRWIGKESGKVVMESVYDLTGGVTYLSNGGYVSEDIPIHKPAEKGSYRFIAIIDNRHLEALDNTHGIGCTECEFAIKTAVADVVLP